MSNPLIPTTWESWNSAFPACNLPEHERMLREMHLLQHMTQVIGEARDFENALEASLQRIGELTGWIMGEAWLPSADGQSLELGFAWHGQTKGLERFKKSSQTFRFQAGQGLPGRVWQKRQPEWIPDVSVETRKVFARTEFAQTAGLKAALGVPIAAKSEVLAVLVFFMKQAAPRDHEIVAVVSTVATQLGWLIQRKRLDHELQVTYSLLEERAGELGYLNARLAMLERQLRAGQTEALTPAQSKDIGKQLLALVNSANSLKENLDGLTLREIKQRAREIQTYSQKLAKLWGKPLPEEETSPLAEKPH